MAPPHAPYAAAFPGGPSSGATEAAPPYQDAAADHPRAGADHPGISADETVVGGLPPGPARHGAPPQQPGDPADATATTPKTGPRKLTVTRVAAFRSKELTTRGLQLFRRAATADGADTSGLTNLTYAVMGNYAVDAAVAVALANTLFFAAARAESTGKVLLYLLITVAPFAVVAPLIGPALDRLQHGRRLALATSSFGRAVLALVMAFNFDSWALYPCALGMLVLSKSFGVLKAAVTPRVVPPDITFVKTNSRLNVFGLLAGMVSGAVAGALAWISGSSGVLIFTALCAVVGGWLCLRIPAWVESTEGEVPVHAIGPRTRPGRTFPRPVLTTLWSNGTIRVETGFLALFIAFVIKSEYSESSGFFQLLLLGVVGAAAGIGGFIGNGLGARLPLNAPELVSILSLAAVLTSTLIAVLAPGLGTAALVGLVGSTASSLAKVCLDSVIQHELPEASRASAFGRSETVLQLSWVFGGVVGLLIGGVWSFGHDRVYSIGFIVISIMLTIGLVQSFLMRRGRSLFPWLNSSRLTGRLRRGRNGKAAGAAGTQTEVTPTVAMPPAGPGSGGARSDRPAGPAPSYGAVSGQSDRTAATEHLGDSSAATDHSSGTPAATEHLRTPRDAGSARPRTARDAGGRRRSKRDK